MSITFYTWYIWWFDLDIDIYKKQCFFLLQTMHVWKMRTLWPGNMAERAVSRILLMSMQSRSKSLKLSCVTLMFSICPTSWFKNLRPNYHRFDHFCPDFIEFPNRQLNNLSIVILFQHRHDKHNWISDTAVSI